MFVISQPLPGAPAADSNAQMKGYVDQLERLGYMLPQDLIVGIILNGLTKDFAGFRRNYNMHNMGKTIGELHAMLIEYEKGLPKKAETPQVMMIKGGKIQKANGLMTRKSFPHHPERATDLLGIIHTDVCGPLRHVSRQGASYFITFTDDYSRYGYVYLLKHKHEVFETFKVFKNEVENQLGKTIKALRSDRGGEYISQENLTTLPLSFWDYALESATRILNMVPTKKVDKTPYELWYGKVPNLSYLKVWGCEALVKRDTPDKLQQRSVKCIFIGYPKETMDEDTSPSEITSEIPMEGKRFEQLKREVIPFVVAMLDSESNKWIDAMNAEIQSMMDNMVWVLVDIPPGYKVVGREAAFILGIKIYRDRSKRLIGLGQTAYMDKILKRYKMDNSKHGHILMQETLDLNKTQGPSTPKEVPYALAVGSIINTKDMFLVYGGNPESELRVDCYCDAGFETDRDDTKSQTGYVFILNGGAVDWKSSKQSTTAMSAIEAEYIAASKAAMEAVWIRKFISGLGARHYHRRYHYVRESIALGEIRFLKVHTDDNLADPFTKALSKGKLTQHARSMGLRLTSSFM
ncbi:retrotransposon protein, putative, ty1-copia subclass [Tanacetum coccineum]